jgi:L-asparagine transporter-like permease
MQRVYVCGGRKKGMGREQGENRQLNNVYANVKMRGRREGQSRRAKVQVMNELLLLLLMLLMLLLLLFQDSTTSSRVLQSIKWKICVYMCLCVWVSYRELYSCKTRYRWMSIEK